MALAEPTNREVNCCVQENALIDCRWLEFLEDGRLTVSYHVVVRRIFATTEKGPVRISDCPNSQQRTRSQALASQMQAGLQGLD